MKLFHASIFPLIALTVISCGGGGGGGSGSGSSSSDSADAVDTSGTLSGRVIDGSVGSSRVCFDMNSDSQCTTSDSYVETDEEGYYEISYEEETIVEEYQLIADVRFSESTDLDYASGTPDYDYVMNAFDQGTGKPNIISPLTTYMNFEQRITGAPASTVASNTVEVIEQYETYQYSEEVEIEYEYTEYVQGDFISNKDSADQHEADFNQRVHNLNEMMARQMQESQAVWEDRFYSGGVNLDSFDWADNSNLVVNNANATVFQSFEEIVEEVTSYDYSTFDALVVSDHFWVDVPSTTEINNLLNYIDALETASNELSGNAYRHSVSVSGSLDYYGYYVFSSEGFSYYIQDPSTGECYVSSAPLTGGLGISESEFISLINEQFALIGGYSPLVRVGGAPANCSSVGTLLASIDTATSIETATEGDIYDNSQDECSGPLCGFEPLPAVVVSPAPVNPPVGSLSSNTAPGTLSTCNYGGNTYAFNMCRAPTRKD